MDQLALSRGAHCVLPWRAVWSTERPCKTAQVSSRRETCCLGWHPSAQPHEAGHALPRARPAKLRLVGPSVSEGLRDLCISTCVCSWSSISVGSASVSSAADLQESSWEIVSIPAHTASMLPVLLRSTRQLLHVACTLLWVFVVSHPELD